MSHRIWDEEEYEWNEDLQNWICEEKKLLLDGKEIQRLITTTDIVFYLFNGKESEIIYEDFEIASITELKYIRGEPGIWRIFLANSLNDEPELIYIKIPNSEKKITLSYLKKSEAMKQVEQWIPNLIKGNLAQDPEFNQFLRDYLQTKEGKFLSKMVEGNWLQDPKYKSTILKFLKKRSY